MFKINVNYIIKSHVITQNYLTDIGVFVQSTFKVDTQNI